MLALRFYVDKKITAKGGGDHSRIIDVAELDQDAARRKVEKLLKSDEEINQVTSITIDDPDGHPLV